MRLELLTSDIPNLFSFLSDVIQDGGRKLYGIEGNVDAVKFTEGKSGFLYKEGQLEASLEVGVLFGGAGFFIVRKLKNGDQEWQRFDHFDTAGIFTFQSDKKVLEPVFVDTFEMDLSCPILNHLYNFLSLEYKKASEGQSWATKLVHTVELFLRDVYQSKIIDLPIKKGLKDASIQNIYNKILEIELDPVLTWEERQIVFNKQKEILNQIVKTKVRAHKLSKSQFKINILKKNLENFKKRFTSRPVNNSKGLFYRYTMGKILWFFRTVKNNLGYSVALAVYGPFTYYFITMPMNPHAMQAVGRVRSAYLDAKTQLSTTIDSIVIGQKNESIPVNVVTDTVKVSQAAVQKEATNSSQNEQNNILANIIYPSAVTASQERDLIIRSNDQILKARPQWLNMIIGTDIEAVDKQNWNERMSQFKQMQIAYEENIEYASRMGRLEQLETQYNFPMQIESTWEELERYNNLIFKIRQENPNLSAKLKQYLTNEVNRTQQLELYLWDRMSRFILDQIYVMLDKDNEQKRNDYYVGRSFVFMQEMTNILSWRYKNFKKPEGFDRIEKLANFYAGNRKELGSIMQNLKENSDLFKQKDVLNTQEFRAYMKRQWEILYLQNSKTEEASNNGLNMYIWSVRNTAWVLQSIYSAKKEELGLLVKRDISQKAFEAQDLTARTKLSMMYETLLHNLTLEYVGIREEIMNRLGKDIESTQRMMVLENLKEFISDRDKLDGINKATAQTTADAQ